MVDDREGNGARKGRQRPGVAGNRPARATIEQVAQEAGVSLATVSRVVNGTSPYISEATRRRVEDAIARLHYTPNRLIRSLQKGRSDVIAYISLDVGPMGQDEFVLTMLHEICRAACVQNHDVLVPVGSITESGLPRASTVMDGSCDGVVLSGPQTVPLLRVLAERGFPTVVLWGRRVPPGIGCVTADNSMGARMAVEHLLSLGHRRIAHLAGPIKRWECAEWRREEYANTLRDAGIAPDKALVLPRLGCDTWAVDAHAVAEALNSWMTLPSPPTAVFCASDRLAVTLIGMAGERGIRVPEDLSVVGFDDMPTARHSVPPLTTISVPLARVATTAVELLLELVAEQQGAPTSDGDLGHVRIVEAELVVRSSTAPPVS